MYSILVGLSLLSVIRSKTSDGLEEVARSDLKGGFRFYAKMAQDISTMHPCCPVGVGSHMGPTDLHEVVGGQCERLAAICNGMVPPEELPPREVQGFETVVPRSKPRGTKHVSVLSVTVRVLVVTNHQMHKMTDMRNNVQQVRFNHMS